MTKKIALVTGASSGIGRGVAVWLAKQGYHVILVARRAALLKSLFEEIQLFNGSSEVRPLDVSDAKNVEKAIEEIHAKHGRIDVLFNAAGILKLGTSEITNQDVDEVLRINLNGAIYVAKHVAAHMKKQKHGYIINVSSIGGKVGSPFAGAYCASKFGLSGFSEALSKEMSLYGVKVSAICPGMVATDMVTKDRDFPAEKMIQVSDIVKTVDYLLSLGDTAVPVEIVVSCLPFIELTTTLTKQAYSLRPKQEKFSK